MRKKTITFTIAALLVWMGLAPTSAQAQGPCSLQTLTGTYAFYEKGSSAIFDPNSEPYPFHWSGAYSSFVTVGEISFGLEGVGDGFFWIREGSFNGGLESIPLQVTITEMNEDCAGKFTFSLTLPGNSDPTTGVERFILFDNGRQFRAIPTEIVNGDSTLTWINEGHRISKPGDPLNTCGPQTSNGSYLMAVENLVRFGATNPILSDALLLRLDVSMTGDYTGMLYEKLGPTGNIMLPVSGRFTVNPDCSYATDLIIDFGGGRTSTAPVRGVFFDQGKKFYGVNMNGRAVGTQFSFGQGERIGE